jgi:hypothetical protein
MRDIIYRAKGEDGKYHYGLVSRSEGLPGQPEAGIYLNNLAGCPWAYKVKPETLGEYIGLCDDNGVPMYEGQRVKVTIDGKESIHTIKYFAEDDYPAFDLSPRLPFESNGISHAKGALGAKIEVLEE